jgi:hypothetical protein
LYFGVDGRPRAGDALRAVERGVLRVVGARAGMMPRAARCAVARRWMSAAFVTFENVRNWEFDSTKCVLSIITR